MRSFLRASLMALTAGSVAGGCAVDDDVGEELEVTCDGKCDGIGTLRSLVRDPGQLDLGDLIAVGAKYAARGVNDALGAADFARIRIDRPRFFAEQERVEGDLTLRSLDELVTGLAARFGERELTTEVNRLRAAHLADSDDEVFVESAFQIGANVGLDWGLDVGGLVAAGGSAKVGFTAGGTLEARVVGAYNGELTGVSQAPLDAIGAARGFLLPTSAADVRAMKPGESIALSGQGALGANLGVGVPILAANPVGPITYSIVLSAGMRTRIAGRLDVQLVRMHGDQVVVDVGVSKVDGWEAYLALDDAWGVQGLLETRISLGGLDVDLGRLVDRALRKQLNRKLSLISANVSSGEESSRVSVARLRFGLDAGDPAAIEAALAQALRGDVRLAQAMSAAGAPGVVAEFDLLRSGSASTSYAGLDLLGMRFFDDERQTQGTATVQTPGGVRSFMFQSLRRSSGSFFSEHGYTRVGLSGLTFDPSGAEPRSEANLFVQLQEADDFMERDKMLDHVDAMLVALGGQAALARVEEYGDAVQRYVTRACQLAFERTQRVNVLSDPEVVRLRAAGVAAAQAAARDLSPDLADLFVQLATFRLTAQATFEVSATLVGPASTWTVDYRLDDAAVTELMTGPDATAVRQAISSYLGAVGIDRARLAHSADRARVVADHAAQIDRMVADVVDAQARYQRLYDVERAVIERLGPIGPRALEVRLPVDSSNRPNYEEAQAQSLAEARQREASTMFDRMVRHAEDLPTHAEQAVAYTLLSLITPERTDLRVSADFDLSDGLAQSLAHYRAAGYAPFNTWVQGDEVAPIDGGLFSIDALVAGQ